MTKAHAHTKSRLIACALYYSHVHSMDYVVCSWSVYTNLLFLNRSFLVFQLQPYMELLVLTLDRLIFSYQIITADPKLVFLISS